MRVSIRDTDALRAVSPMALSAYARNEGWAKTDDYGEHSDVYTADGWPEVIIPRTQRLGDYAEVVSRLIDIFAGTAETDELTLYRDLVTADRDVIRVRAAESDDGTVPVDDGLGMMQGMRDMLMAAACSLKEPRPFYHRAGSNQEASEFLRRVRLGQTEQGSFAITLLTPAIAPPMQPAHDELGQPVFDLGLPIPDPIERQVTRRLAHALDKARHATERTAGGDPDAFFNVVEDGVSANLCSALGILVKSFAVLDIGLVWARTYPVQPRRARDVVSFAQGDAAILQQAAQSLRQRSERGSRPDARLFGFVRRLRRDQQETDGTVTLRAHIDNQVRSVIAELSQTDYERAIGAHKGKAAVIAEGDLERIGQRWHLLNPRISQVIPSEDVDENG